MKNKSPVEKTDNKNEQIEPESTTQSVSSTPIIESEGEEEDYEAAALKGQQVLNEEIAARKVDILKLLARLEKVGGSEDYSYTIKAALGAYGGSIRMAVLTQVVSDHEAFTAARDDLSEKRVITETAKKNRKTLHLVPAVATAA